MTVQELIEQLSELNPDAEVRLAKQPGYPLWCSVHGVSAGTAEGESVYDHDESTREEADFVYLTEGGDDGYASSTLWEEQ